MSFQIRPGKLEDCPQIHELIKELARFEKAENEMTLSLDDLEKDGFGENPAYGIYVAEKEGQVIGIALYYQKYSTWKGKCLYLEDLIVSEKFRGIGAGKALFEALINEAKKRNSGRLEWQVLDWNQGAIDFYKSYGAHLDGEWINGQFRAEDLQKMND